MPDLKPIVDALIKGAPTAAYVALVGIIWQAFYALVRNCFARKEAVDKLRLESELLALQPPLNLQREPAG